MDSQALGNALYGLQSMNSIHSEVRSLVAALAKEIGESSPTLSIQSIGAALYGLQKMSSDSLEVRALLAALSEKIEASNVTLDAQAVGNALFGLQKVRRSTSTVQFFFCPPLIVTSKHCRLLQMNSNNAEVRSLVSALTGKLMKCGDDCSPEQIEIDSKGIGSALYGKQVKT